MTNERAEKLEQLMNTVHEAIEELQEVVRTSDIKWAKKYLNSKNCEDNGDLEELAYGLTGFGENLKDCGKNFDYTYGID